MWTMVNGCYSQFGLRLRSGEPQVAAGSKLLPWNVSRRKDSRLVTGTSTLTRRCTDPDTDFNLHSRGDRTMVNVQSSTVIPPTAASAFYPHVNRYDHPPGILRLIGRTSRHFRHPLQPPGLLPLQHIALCRACGRSPSLPAAMDVQASGTVP